MHARYDLVEEEPGRLVMEICSHWSLKLLRFGHSSLVVKVFSLGLTHRFKVRFTNA
jgi:hypothetical protein